MLAVAAAPAAGRPADPVITTDRATLATGAAPVRGVVQVLPGAPKADPPAAVAVAAPAPIAGLSGVRPDFTAGGTGALGAFHATADATLPGGEYDFTTYSVDAGVTVTYTSAVAIRCAGTATVRGRVRTIEPDAPLTLTVRGDLTLAADGSFPSAGIEASGPRSSLDVTCGATFLATTTDEFAGAVMGAAAGASLRAAEDVDATGLAVFASGGDAVVQAWGGSVSLTGAFLRSALGDVFVEGSTGVSLGGFSTVSGLPGGARLRSPLGPLRIDGGSALYASDGDVTIESRGDLTVESFVEIYVEGTGDLRVVSTQGGVHLGTATPDASVDEGPDTTDVIQGSRGDVTVHAAGPVVLGGSVALAAALGDVSVRAGADLVAEGAHFFVSEAGPVALRAVGEVRLAADRRIGDDAPPRIEASSAAVTSGRAGSDLELSAALAVAGTFEALSAGAVRIDGPVVASGGVTVRSSADGIDVAGSTLVTSAATGTSGTVLLETYSASIRADGATLVSGDATQRSGDVRLLIHSVPPKPTTPTTLPPPAEPAATSPFAVTRASCHGTPRRSDAVSVSVDGFVEGGLRGVAASLPGRFSVGGVLFVAQRSTEGARRIRYSGDGFRLTVTAPRRNEGRTKFRLRAVGPAPADLAPDGSGRLRLRFDDAVVAGRAEVELDRGRFVVGTGRGSLVVPEVYVLSAEAAPGGDGRGRLVVRAVVPASGGTPDDVTLALGESFRADVPAALLLARGPGRFVAKSPSAGVASAAVDTATGVLTVELAGVDLGARTGGAALDVAFTLGYGDATRDVRLRLAADGRVFRY